MRKLAWAALSFTAAVFLSHYVIPSEYRVYVMAMLAAIALFGGLLLRDRRRMGILLICIFGILGILRYELQVQQKLEPSNALNGTVCEITAIVTEFPTQYDTYSKITVRLTTEGLPKSKAVFYDYSDDCDLSPGDLICGSVQFTSATVASGEETDTYISKGIYLRGYLKSELTVIGRWWGSWLFAPAYLAQWIRDTIDRYVPMRAAVFMKALLTGDKTALYDQPQLYHILSKAGIAHIVAVSGMHILFLTGLVLMIAGNRRGRILSIMMIALFAVMTGLSPSVMRAMFMQLLYLLAPILRREPDSISSVSFALLILLLINPFAAASVSLQLSFAAVFGIILITPRMMIWLVDKGENLSGWGKKAYIFVSSSLSASLGATILTAPLCAYYFGYVSLLAPLTNLLILWLVPFCFGGGFLICIVSCMQMKIAGMLGMILSWMVEFIYWAAGIIAKSPLAAAYLPTKLLAFWFAIVYLLFAVSYLRKGNKAYRPLLPACVAIITLFAMMIGVIQYYRNRTTIAAIDVGQGQSIVVMDGDSTVMIDCGGTYDAGQRAADWMYSHGRYNIDMLILTHYDTDHVNGVSDLMTRIPITQILCSGMDLSEHESAAFEEITAQAGMYQTKVTCISETVQFRMEDMIITAYLLEKTSDNDGIIVLTQIGDYDLLVTGDADLEQELKLLVADTLPDGECIVAGHHGSAKSTGMPILDVFDPETAIISCGYNSYGHPTQEVLDRLEERNVIVYRTDELGSIEIKVR